MLSHSCPLLCHVTHFHLYILSRRLAISSTSPYKQVKTRCTKLFVYSGSRCCMDITKLTKNVRIKQKEIIVLMIIITRRGEWIPTRSTKERNSRHGLNYVDMDFTQISFRNSNNKARLLLLLNLCFVNFFANSFVFVTWLYSVRLYHTIWILMHVHFFKLRTLHQLINKIFIVCSHDFIMRNRQESLF